MTRKQIGNALIITGSIALIIAAAVLLFNLFQDKEAGRQSNEVLEEIESLIHESGDSGDNSSEMPTVYVDSLPYIGTVCIPAIGIKLPVINEWSLAGAKIAPCRYTGSIYDGSLIIAGHNFSSHFGFISSLKAGDEVYFTDIKGNKYVFSVLKTEIIEKKDVNRMVSGKWDLTLFTCTIGGKQRITVRCISR